MEKELYQLHYEQEKSHWWFAARFAIVRKIIERYGNLSQGDTILDIGCGTGAIMERLSHQYHVIGIDTSPLAVEYAKKRGLKDVYEMYVQDFPADKFNVKAALLLDVIEHIDDDLSVLQTARNIVGKDGRIIITVPANEWMWSSHDVMNHHKRRYTAESLRGVLAKAGLTPVKFTYYNTFLFPLAALQRLFVKNKSADDAREQLGQPAPIINGVLKTVFSSERFIVPKMYLPFGVSLLTVVKPID